MKKGGFTIVELLVVFVVIGILATITVVSYRGLKERAQTESLTIDLTEAAKEMELAKLNSNTYPSTLPSSVKAGKGNVLQLTAVPSSETDFCINGYGPGNTFMSVRAGGKTYDYLCSGVTVGSSVGGATPTAPRGVNLVPGFSAWTVSGDISYNPSDDSLVCGGTANGAATSPKIRVDSPVSGNFRYQGMATTAAVDPARPYSGSYVSSQYYAANGTTAVYNTSPSPGPYTGNGHAYAFTAFGSWQNGNFSMTLGPNVIYVNIIVRCSPSNYTSDTRYRNPTFTVQ